MKRILRAVSVAAMLVGTTVLAQPGGPGGMGASMAKFFGQNRAFTAKVETIMQGPSQPGPITMEMTMSMLDGKIRVEMDLTTMKGAGNQAARMKQMGMDKTVTVMRPDKKISYMIFPNMNAYAENVLTDKQAADMMDTTSKIDKTSMGKETVGGHSCEKNKVTVTSEDGQKHVVFVWNAKDLKEFPVKMQMDEHGMSMVMTYTDVKLEKPEAKLFEPPTGYTKYSSMQSLMQTEMMKRAGAGGGPPGPK